MFRFFILNFLIAVQAVSAQTAGDNLELARRALDPQTSIPEIFLFPAMSYETFNLKTLIESPSQKLLNEQFDRALQFFQTNDRAHIIFDKSRDSWSSDELKNNFKYDSDTLVKKIKENQPLDNKEKAILVHVFSLYQLLSVRASSDSADIALIRDFTNYFEQNTQRTQRLLDVDLSYRTQSSLEAELGINQIISKGIDAFLFLKKKYFIPFSERSFISNSKDFSWLEQKVEAGASVKAQELTLAQIAVIKVLDRLFVTDTKAPPYSWSESDLASIVEVARGSKGELSSSSIETIIKDSKKFKRSQIEARGKLNALFRDRDQNNQESINQSTQIATISAIALLALMGGRLRDLKSSAKIELSRPQSEEAMLDQMLLNAPDSWLSRAGALKKREALREMLNEGQIKLADSENKPLEPNTAFKEAFVAAFRTREFKGAFSLKVFGHLWGENSKLGPKMKAELENLLALESRRTEALIKMSSPVIDEFAQGGISLKSSRQSLLRELGARKNLKQIELNYLKQRNEIINRIVGIPSRSERRVGIEDGSLAYEFTFLPRYILGPWLHPLSEKKLLKNAKIDRPESAMINPNKNPEAGSRYTQLLPGETFAPRKLRSGCLRSLRFLGRSAGISIASLGLGVGLWGLANRPLEPDAILDQEEKKQNDLAQKNNLQKDESLKRVSKSIYLSVLAAQLKDALIMPRPGHLEKWTNAEGKEEVRWVGAQESLNQIRMKAGLPELEVIILPDSMTDPLEETAMNASAYALVKIKEDATDVSLDERFENAAYGIVLKFDLVPEGSNLSLALKLQMKSEDIPQKLGWNFAGYHILEGDDLARSLIRLKKSELSKVPELELNREPALGLLYQSK